MAPKGFLEGWIDFYAGNKERAYTALDSVRWSLEMEAKENPGDQQAHLYVALTYAAMGWKGRCRAGGSLARERKAKFMADGGAFVHAGEATPHCASSSSFLLQSESTLITICV